MNIIQQVMEIITKSYGEDRVNLLLVNILKESLVFMQSAYFLVVCTCLFFCQSPELSRCWRKSLNIFCLGSLLWFDIEFVSF